MAAYDYNPVGGTSQSLIDDYHYQMADIDRQLYETGKYTGPVYNSKTQQVEEHTLNKRQAERLKNALWYQADKLEGYSLTDRHQKSAFKEGLAFLGRLVKMLNPIYTIKRFIAWRDFRKENSKILARGAMYEDMLSKQGYPAAPMSKQPIQQNVPDAPDKNEQIQTEKTPAMPEKTNQNNNHDNVQQASETKDVKKESTENVQNQEQTNEQPKKDYEAIFYQELEKRMFEGGMTQKDAMIELINENPMRSFNIRPQDITPEIATQAVIKYAEVKKIPTTKAYTQLTKKQPAIAMADTREKAANAYKAIPSVIENNPETLKYLSAGQLNKKNVEYLMNDIKVHAEKNGKDPSAALQEFIDTALKIKSPAVDKLKEHLTALQFIPDSRMVPQFPENTLSENTQPQNQNAATWKDIPELAQAKSMLENDKMIADTINCYPENQRDEIWLNSIIHAYPELFEKLPENEQTAELATVVMATKPSLLIMIPEKITIEEMKERLPEVLKSLGDENLQNAIKDLDQSLAGGYNEDLAKELVDIRDTFANMSPEGQQKNQQIH